jgi:hypothetical protein
MHKLQLAEDAAECLAKTLLRLHWWLSSLRYAHNRPLVKLLAPTYASVQ